MYEASFSNDVPHIAQLCVRWHSGKHENGFSSDVSHMAQSCVTRHAEKRAKPCSRMTCHTLHNHVWHVIRETCTVMCDTSLRNVQNWFSNDVSHIAQSCVTHHSRNERGKFVEWHVTHCTIMCGTSLRKWTKQDSAQTGVARHSGNERNMFTEWRVTHCTIMYVTPLRKWAKLDSALSWATCHTENERSKYSEWRVTHCTIMYDTSRRSCMKRLSRMTCHAGLCYVWHIALEVSVSSMCDTSFAKAFSCLSWVMWHTCLCNVDAPHSPHHLIILLNHSFSLWLKVVRPTIWWDQWDIGGAFHLEGDSAPHCVYLVGRYACVEFEVSTTAPVREWWKAPHRNNRFRWSELIAELAKYFRNKVMSIRDNQWV